MTDGRIFGDLWHSSSHAIGDAEPVFAQTHIPYFDIFGQPPRTVSFEFYRLVPVEMDARQESSSAA